MSSFSDSLVNCGINLIAEEQHLLIEFKQSIEELEENQQKLLLRSFLALQAIPEDKGIERLDLLHVIRALRQAWITIKYSQNTFTVGPKIRRKYSPYQESGPDTQASGTAYENF